MSGPLGWEQAAGGAHCQLGSEQQRDRSGQLLAWLEATPGQVPWEQLQAGIEWVLEDLDPAIAAAMDRHWKWYWPMAHFQTRGIEMGKQWAVLGWLACRYARDFTVDGLAHELWKVMEASPQEHRRPWRWRHAADIARRAKRFIERADAAEATAVRAYLGSSARPPGTRQPGSRRPGVRA
jgi:hypothetical protein